MPQLQYLARQQGNTTQLATTSKPDPDQIGTSSTAEGSKLHKPSSKPKKGPTQHNHFTAEMDLAAAGLLGQALPPPMPVPPKAACDRLQTGLSWPLRPKRSLEGQQQQQLTHQHSWTGQAAPQQLGEQGEPGGKLCQNVCVGQQSVWRERCEQQGDVSSSQELSPGAKEALILAGLLSEDQVCFLPQPGMQPCFLPQAFHSGRCGLRPNLTHGVLYMEPKQAGAITWCRPTAACEWA